MLDFSKLLTTVADEIKRKPNQKPIPSPLPSEKAMTEVITGIEDSTPSTPWEGSKDFDQRAVPQAVPTIYPITNVQDEVVQSSDSPVTRYPDTPVQTDALSPQVSAPIEQSPIQRQQQRLRELEDKPIEKQSFWKDFGAKLIQGADAFFNGNRAPIVGWGRLKKDAEIAKEKGKLGSLIEAKKIEDDAIATHQKQTMNNLEYGLKLLKEQRDALEGNATWQEVKASKRIRPDQAEYLNKKFNTKLTPNYWGGYKETSVGEDALIRPEDRPNYMINSSVPKNAPQAFTNVTIGDQTYPSTNKDALQAQIGINQFNANQAGQTERFNVGNKVEVDKANVANAMKFSDDMRAVMGEVAKNQSQVLAASPAVAAGARDLQTMAAQIAQAEEDGDTKLLGELQKQFQARQQQFYKDLQTVQGGVDLAGRLQQIMPKPPQRIPYSTAGGQQVGQPKVVSEAIIKKAMRDKKVSREVAVQTFKDAGYTIQ